MNQETKKLLLFSVFMISITCSILISAKIATVFTLSFAVGAIAYAVLFAVTDVVSEAYGRNEANKLVYFGWLAYALAIVYSQMAIHLPPAPFWMDNQNAYENILGTVPRIVIGSLVAYSISQYHDIWAFHFWKKITNDKHLWLRNNLSTVTSQFIDSVIFIMIAFYGIVPDEQLAPLIIGQFVIKILIAVMDTPIVYWLSSWAKK